MAEAIYNKLTNTSDAKSAGVDLGHSSLGARNLSVPSLIVDVMKEIGLDISNNKRKQITREMVDDAKKVVVIMSEGDYPLPEYLANSPKMMYWNDVPDGKGHDLVFLRNIRNILEDKINNLVAQN
jgi:protein-tyrosine-phosphatase